VVGTLYVQKFALNRLGNPDCLRVTLDATAAASGPRIAPVERIPGTAS